MLIKVQMHLSFKLAIQLLGIYPISLVQSYTNKHYISKNMDTNQMCLSMETAYMNHGLFTQQNTLKLSQIQTYL